MKNFTILSILLILIGQIHNIDENSSINNMTLEEKVAQMFYVSVEDYTNLNLPFGGIIFFKHNIQTKEGTIQQINKFQLASKIPLFIGSDEEGGSVSRITGKNSITGIEVPTAWTLAHSDEPSAVYTANSIIAKEIGALGFNMNFAPVADINSNKANPIIGHRAFSDIGADVAKYVQEAMLAYDTHNIIPVIKHFPGHGDTYGDSHLEAVTVKHDLNRLYAEELLPFRAGIESGINVIMIGHIQVPEVTNNDLPASLSERMIQDILREDLQFNGVVISDALNMQGITNHYTTQEVIDLGLVAGLNMFLMPESTTEAYNYLLERAKNSKEVECYVNESVSKILELKANYYTFSEKE